MVRLYINPCIASQCCAWSLRVAEGTLEVNVADSVWLPKTGGDENNKPINQSNAPKLATARF